MIKIYEFTDPACTWCWGSEPILRKLETHYGENVEIGYIMGGLVEDANNFYDRQNNIGGDLKTMNKQVAEHWLEASSKHGMPVMVEDYKLMTEDHRSTYPMNIAYKAAELIDKILAKKYLRRIREAVASEGVQANRPEILIELADEIGLDIKQFKQYFTDGTARKAFFEDKNFAIKNRVTGFPSYLMVNDVGEEVLLRGYQTFDNFTRMISRLSSNNLSPELPQNNLDSVEQFINLYKKVAPIEIMMALNLNQNSLDLMLDELIALGKIEIQYRGNGYFVLYKEPDNLTCDVKSGICSV